MRTRFPLIQTFFPNQVGKSGLVIPRMVLTVGEVEEGLRRKAFLFFFSPQGLSRSPMWLNKPKTNSAVS